MVSMKKVWNKIFIYLNNKDELTFIVTLFIMISDIPNTKVYKLTC